MSGSRFTETMENGSGSGVGVLETALFLEVSFLGIASMQAARKAMVAPRDRFMRIRSLSTCEKDKERAC